MRIALASTFAAAANHEHIRGIYRTGTGSALCSSGNLRNRASTASESGGRMELVFEGGVVVAATTARLMTRVLSRGCLPASRPYTLPRRHGAREAIAWRGGPWRARCVARERPTRFGDRRNV